MGRGVVKIPYIYMSEPHAPTGGLAFPQIFRGGVEGPPSPPYRSSVAETPPHPDVPSDLFQVQSPYTSSSAPVLSASVSPFSQPESWSPSSNLEGATGFLGSFFFFLR